jgi:platelet-activating factor acetylhydrolase
MVFTAASLPNMLTQHSASLEFLRLVTPNSGGGKAIIDRCMTDESILRTEILEDIPDDHRPDDEWIAAKLRVDHEFKRRMGASIQRKFKRNFQGGMGTGYTTSDEVWCHFKPTEEQLEKWIKVEERGEKRIDEQAATRGDGGDAVVHTGENANSTDVGDSDQTTSLSDADQDSRRDDSEGREGVTCDGETQNDRPAVQSSAPQSRKGDEASGHTQANVSAATADDTSNNAPTDTWLGILPALRDGPQQA